MGMPQAFGFERGFFRNDRASAISLSRQVIHKAYIDVNEEGTEAAAATAVTMRALAMRAGAAAPVFRADHPFVFLIRDNRRTASCLWAAWPIREIRSSLQPPLGARIRDAKALAFGITLRLAARLSHHHRQFIAMFEGVAHPSFEERCLESAPAHLRNGRRPGEQGHPIMKTQRARGTGFTIQLGDKIHTMLRVQMQRRRIVRESPASPDFLAPIPARSGQPIRQRLHATATRTVAALLSCAGGSLHRPVQHAAEFDRPVTTST